MDKKVKGMIKDTSKRTYKTVTGSKWRTRLSQILMSGKPLFFVKIDTSGLDPKNDRIVGIVISRNHFEDDKLIMDDEFATLVLPYEGFEMPEEITKINEISTTLLQKKGMPFEEAMKKMSDFLGTDANVSGFNTREFIGPFLENEAKRAGIKLSIKYTFDMLHMAKALIPPTNPKYNPGYKVTATRLGVDPNTGMAGYLNVFNKMYARMPVGLSKSIIKKDEYWEKSYTCRYIYLHTDCGKIALNCYTGCFEEVVPGSFDQVDLDALTDFIMKKQNVKNMYEFIKKYNSKSKFAS